MVEGGPDVGQVGFGKQPQAERQGAEPLGAESDLLLRLLGGHQQGSATGDGVGGQRLEDERGLAHPGLAAQQGDGSGRQAAAEHPVELGDAGGAGFGLGAVDLGDGQGDVSLTRAGREGRRR